MKKKHGDIEFRRGGKLVIVKDVDYFQCENCGERVYSRETTTEILRKLKTKSTRKYIRVPVYA
ncbi:MAG: YgiT-type zinc finger protein [Bacteroidetes bacterium]|nr:YgiT-type zinc finger protein [Bacteroidota bacterium]